jgi:GABA permease
MAIVGSSVVGFLSVVMAGVAPGTVFLFLLNSSGAIVLFVYLLIALSQIVLRFKTPPEKLRVKMWFFPVLSILTLLAIVGVLVQMAFNSTVRSQFWLSLLSWAVVVVLYFLAKWRRGRVEPSPTDHAGHVWVRTSETASETDVFSAPQSVEPEQESE